eukprot:jgi/Pico_ML_1/52307/g3032.t2
MSLCEAESAAAEEKNPDQEVEEEAEEEAPEPEPEEEPEEEMKEIRARHCYTRYNEFHKSARVS